MFSKIINRTKNNKILLILPLLLTAYTLSSISIIYSILKINNVENFLRYIICLFVFFLLVYIYILSLKFMIKGKQFGVLFFSFLLLFLFTAHSFTSATINRVYNSINRISRNTITYSTSLVALKQSGIKELEDVKNLKIGIIDDENSIDGYIISNEIIEKNNLDNNDFIEYENFAIMLSDLYNNELDLIFISSNYVTMFANSDTETNRYINIEEETVVITKKSKSIEKDKIVQRNRNLEDPFTLLIMGVDSTEEDINKGSAFNGDALMVITFNPKTFNATILSIPRDTYVPIMCFRNERKNKITHAAWYGESCMISTIENFTGIDIDHYVKINFKGLVNLVDALDGIYVDVPITFCEQNSKRQWGENTIYIEKGYQKLYGEESLALTRHRIDRRRCGEYYVNNYMNDIKRGLNQQLVINGLLDRLKDVRSLDEIYKMLDVIETSINTSITTSEILSLYNIGKDIIFYSSDENTFSLEQLFLSGYTKTIWDEGMRLPLSNYVYYEQSLEEVVNAMKINLEKQEPTLIKEFSFSINDPYEKRSVGRIPFGSEPKIQIVPNFVGKDKSEVLNWGTSNGINIVVEFEDVDSSYYQNQVISQSIPYSYKVKNINSNLIIKVANIIEKNNEDQDEDKVPNENIDCSKEENITNEICLIPDFSSYTIEMAKSWKSRLNTSIVVTIKEIEPLDSIIDFEEGKFHSQSVPAGTNISEIKEIILSFYTKIKQEQ